MICSENSEEVRTYIIKAKNGYSPNDCEGADAAADRNHYRNCADAFVSDD